MDNKTYYDVLGIPRDATILAIKKAYRRKSLEFHPDRNRSPDATAIFQRINAAYEVLSDPYQRAFYDMGLKENRAPPQHNERPQQKPAENIFEDEFRDVLNAAIDEILLQGNGVPSIEKIAAWSAVGALAFGIAAYILAAPAALPSALLGAVCGTLKGYTGRDMSTVYHNLSDKLKTRVINFVAAKYRKK